MVKHIIFDMDGTLADTAKATSVACAQISKKYGLPPLSNEKICEAIGYANPEFYFYLYPNVKKRTMLAYGQEVETLEESIVWDMGTEILFPGVLTMLESLVSHGKSLYLASTGDVSHVNAVLTTAGIQHFFDIIGFGRPNKEDMVSQMIIGNTARWCMVGDKKKDLSAARVNGILAIAAGYGYLSVEDAKKFDHVLKAPAQLLDIVYQV